MKNQIKKVLINVAPYGVVEKHRGKKRELEEERKRLEKERLALEKKQQKEEEKRQKFLATSNSPRWGRFYADYHEKEAIEDKWVLYESSAGIGMTCNPYAIFRAFMKMPEFTDYVHIWAIQDEEEMELLKEDYRAYKNVIFISYHSRAYSYFLAKAKYLINNTSFADAFSKREGQIFLNTWHSITVKTLGYDTPDGNRVVGNMVRNLLMSDYIISPNEFMTEIFEKSFRLANIYEGRYICEGYPRNDFVVDTKRDEILHKMEVRGTKVDPTKKVILYAPTWTGNAAARPVIDMGKYTGLYEYLMANINTDEYQVLMKPHPVVYKNLSVEARESGRYISYGVDTNELLSVVDILITDYSSIYFDYLLTDKPILFYIPDYKSYENARGIYFKPQELPGPCSKELSELLEQISHIGEYEKHYQKVRKQTREWACRYDDGNVSQKMIDIVFRGSQDYKLLQAARTGKKKILMYAGAFLMNGMTSASLNLLHNIDYDTYDVTVYTTALRTGMQNYNFDRLPGEIRVLLRCGVMPLTEENRRIYEDTTRNGFYIAPEDMPMQDYLMKREYMRCFGVSSYDYIIDFSGYAPYFMCLTAKQCPQAKKMIWQHSDLKEEFMNEEKRKLNETATTLEGLLSVYPYCDKVVSASKTVCEVNKENLATDKTRGKFVYSTNLMDAQRTEEMLQSAGSCQMDGRDYVRIVNELNDNGTMDATLIPFPLHEKDCVKFVTMGRCMPEKNHKSIILALKRLIDEGVSCRLFIIGDGHMREELESLAEDLGIEDKVTITGFITNPYAILKECDCFVFPSSYEAQGLAVLEARIVQLPIVVSNYPAVKSVMLEDKQYIIEGTDENAVYEGMRAYLDGKVSNDYYFDVAEYNRKAYQEFLELL